MWDFPNNKALQNISEQIYRQGGVVSAVCHGVGGLLPLQNENGKPLIAGRTVTGFTNIEKLYLVLSLKFHFLYKTDSLNVEQTTNKHLFHLPRMWFQTTELLLDKPQSSKKCRSSR